MTRPDQVTTSVRPSAADAVPDIADAVAEAFAQVLERNRESITAESDFFDLGGNSIRAAQVVARLRGTVQVRVTMRDLFLARTAGVLADVLRERAAAGARPPDSL